MFLNFYVLGASKKHCDSLGIQYIFNHGWTKEWFPWKSVKLVNFSLKSWKVTFFMDFHEFCEKVRNFALFRFLDSRGRPGGPEGGRKGSGKGPPPESWKVKKSKKPLPPAIRAPSSNAPIINKAGFIRGPGRAPFFRQVAFSVFRVFMIFTWFSWNS